MKFPRKLQNVLDESFQMCFWPSPPDLMLQTMSELKASGSLLIWFLDEDSETWADYHSLQLLSGAWYLNCWQHCGFYVS